MQVVAAEINELQYYTLDRLIKNSRDCGSSNGGFPSPMTRGVFPTLTTKFYDQEAMARVALHSTL